TTAFGITMGSATTTDTIYVGGKLTVIGNTTLARATTTNFAITGLGGGGGDLKVAADGSIYEGTDATGGGGESAWEYDAAADAMVTTSTKGIMLTASSSIGANFRIDGNATTTGAHSIGELSVNNAYWFPTTAGSSNQILKTDANGLITWQADATGSGGSAAWEYDSDWDAMITTSTKGILITASSTFQDSLTVQRAAGGNETLFQVGTSTDEDIFVIKSNGNIGIGTTSPSSKLSVSGNGYITGGLGVGIVNTIACTPIINGAFVGALQVPNGSIVVPSAASASNPAYAFYSDTNTGINNPASENLAFITNAVERVRIDSNGNVGIGTTTPDSKLVVAGQIHASTTVNQLKLSYDDSTSKYATFSVDSNG
ncbi:MAG: hypothetical protein L6275_01680, partial [Candidatus Portnoybacteria bacterium]|nr:hypothetical protein [Candidatus Portnoybacteria bacterium]